MSANNIKSSIFSAYTSMMNSVEADNTGGGGGWWPEPGEHEVVLTAITQDEGQFTQNDGQKFPSSLIRFAFQLLNDPDSPASPRSFRGAPFNFPLDPSKINEKGKIRIEIEMRRLKGHLTTILGRDPTDMVAALAEVDNTIKANTVAILVRVNADKSPTNGKVYNKEFILRSIMG